MHAVDWTIVGLYLVGLLTIGFLLARKAARGDEAYFLGGRKMPWWALGASGMSSNLDVAGTTAIIALIYHYGLHGFFIEFRGGVVLPIAVWLAFMGKWHRRSRVTTTAQWMHLRFRDGADALSARMTAAVTYLVITVGMVVFFLTAAGQFLAEFWPGTPSVAALHEAARELAAAEGGQAAALREQLEQMQAQRYRAEMWLSIGMATAALIYTAAAGLYGVVWTDVFQAFLIGAAAIYTSVIAFNLVTPELIAQWPGAAFNTPWPQVYHAGLDKADVAPGLGNYSFFALFLAFFLAKGVLEGLGGSGGSAYMAQRFYAAPDDASTRKLTLLWGLLFTFRWPMVLGLAVIAIAVGVAEAETEVLLPTVLQSEYFPIGITGLMIAALFAASMSTFDSTINAGASYVVKDLYVPVRPDATPRQQVFAGYAASLGIVALGLGITLLWPVGVLEVWRGIVLLFSAFLVPFALRWFWPRFTGIGFTVGIASGFVGLLVISDMVAGRVGGAYGRWALGLNEAWVLGIGAGASLVGCVVGTYLTPAADGSQLREFYRQIRPLGFWPRAWREKDRAEHRADWVRLPVALVWQILTFMLPMLVVLKMWVWFLVLLAPWAVLMVYLWRDAWRAPGDEAADTRHVEAVVGTTRRHLPVPHEAK